MRTAAFLLLLHTHLAYPLEWIQTTVLNDLNSSLTATFPKLGTDDVGNAVAIWSVSEFTNFMPITIEERIQSARLTAGSTTWVPTPIPDNISAFHEIATEQQLAVNGVREAVGVWRIRDTGMTDIIEGARLPEGSNVWGPDTTISVLDDAIEPDVGIDAEGNAVAVWQALTAPNSLIRGARSAGGSNVWVLTGDLTPNPGVHFNAKIAVNEAGDSVAVWVSMVNASLVIRGARLPAGSNTWEETTNFASLTTLDATDPSVAIDQCGTAVVVYTTDAGGANPEVRGAKLPAGSDTWVLAANPIAQNAQNPEVAIDPCEEAVVVFEGDLPTSVIQAARLPRKEFEWVPTDNNVSSESNVDKPDLDMDDFGNTIAVWRRINGSRFQGAILPAQTNTWIETNQILTLQADNPVVSLNADGSLAVSLFSEIIPNPPFNDIALIRGGIAVDCFPPLRPQNIAGAQIKNCFATQTEFFNRIFWTASPSPDVVSYKILKNGMLIKTVPKECKFIFVDHDIQKGQINTYEIIAVADDGRESFPISITLPQEYR